MSSTRPIDQSSGVTRTPVLLIASGALLALAGLVLFGVWGGLDELQIAADPEDFAATALRHGDDVRWASWADIALFVPGDVLFLAGVLAFSRRAADTPVAVRRASLLGTPAAVAGGVADQVENSMVQVGLRAVGLSATDAAEAGQPSEGVITALNAATTGKYLFGAVALIVLGGLALRAAFRRFSRRSAGAA